MASKIKYDAVKVGDETPTVTIENVARAKAELIEELRPGGIAVVPGGETLLEPFLVREDRKSVV